MNEDQISVSFGEQLKALRSRAGFPTLQSLSEELIHYGLIVDHSLLSHWQRGARLPRDRQVILLLLALLVKNRGLEIPQEANQFCEAAGMGFLTEKEMFELFPKEEIKNPPHGFTVPKLNVYFTAAIAQEHLYGHQYHRIVNSLKKLGHQVLHEHITAKTLNSLRVDTHQDRTIYYQKLLHWISACDVVIAETSHSSLGVGHEISLALERNKPTIVLYTEGYAPHFLEGRESNKLYIAKYDLNSIEKVLVDILKKIFPSEVDHSYSYFGGLLKTFRLRAGFFTLQQLSQELEFYGIEVDSSLLSHWQRGARLPKDRQVILLLLKILVNNKGITTIEEANQLCEAAGMGFLTNREQNEVFPAEHTQVPHLPKKEESEQLQIYFSAALSQKNTFSEVYKKIVQTLKTEGHTVYEDTTIVDLEEAINKNKNERVTYYRQVLLWIDRADVLVVEVSFPSTLHIGHEVSLALERKKRVIAFYKKGLEPSFFLGSEDPNLIWVEYTGENIEELVRKNIKNVIKNRLLHS